MAEDTAIADELARLDREAAAGNSNSAASGMENFDLSGFDISDVDPTQRSFSLIPDGTFVPVGITRCLGKTSSSGKAMLDMEYTTFAGDYKSRKVWDNIMLVGNKTRYVMLLSALGLYDEVNKRSLAKSPADIHGKKLWLKLSIEKGSQKPNSSEFYQDRNKPAPWDGFYPINTYALPEADPDANVDVDSDSAYVAELTDPFAGKATQQPQEEHREASPGTPLEAVKVQEQQPAQEGVATNATAKAGPVEDVQPQELQEVEEPAEVLERGALQEPGVGGEEPNDLADVPQELQDLGYTSAPVDGLDGPAVDVVEDSESDAEMLAMEAELERKRLERKNKGKVSAVAGATVAEAVSKGSAQAERPENWN